MATSSNNTNVLGLLTRVIRFATSKEGMAAISLTVAAIAGLIKLWRDGDETN